MQNQKIMLDPETTYRNFLFMPAIEIPMKFCMA